MIKIKYFIVSIILMFSTTVFAQKGEYVVQKESDWQDRIYFGGGFGLAGGSGYTSISVSPIVGYMISSRMSGGVGASYEYYKNGNFTDDRWGGQVFLRMNLLKQIFAYGSYRFVNYTTFGSSGTEGRTTVGRLPLGLGLSQPIGKRSSVNFLAAYDVIYDDQLGAYNSPWVFSVFFSL